jgi:hypothetical protein
LTWAGQKQGRRHHSTELRRERTLKHGEPSGKEPELRPLSEGTTVKLQFFNPKDQCLGKASVE